jgi:predicted nucleic-acid-binding protein
MIGLDTNVLLAWLLAGHSQRLPDAPAYRVSLVVLAELVWVLARTLKHSKTVVCSILDELMQASNVVVDRREIVELALEDYRSGPADFADYVIARDNEAASCRTTLTFDMDAGRQPAFTLLRR